jgi:hypothetical protein
MSDTRKVLLGAALGGMFAASVCFAEGGTDSTANDKGSKKAGPKVVMCECHGMNECKGMGECGGKGHECAGKNECKGKGWVKMTMKECKSKKGTFKKMKM